MRKTFDALSDPDRLRLAKERTNRLVDHLSTLFTLNEANRLVIYSDLLAKQIPPSYAANAFVQFQMSMHLFELVRLCALWDSPRDDRESIPTILALIDKRVLLETVALDTHRFYAEELSPAHLSPSSSPEHEAAYKAWWETERQERAEEEADKVRTRVATARDEANAVLASPELRALRNFRDRYIAHNLDFPEPPAGSPNPVPKVNYGDEKLLATTVDIADRLHLALNGTSYDWNGSREIAASNARDLWAACRFEGIGRERSKHRETRNFILDARREE